MSFHGDLWHSSVASGGRLVRCLLGCWHLPDIKHSCKRDLHGPIAVKGHGTFSNAHAMRQALRTRGVWFVGDLAVAVKTHTQNKVPTSVRVVLGAQQVTFVCVTWVDALRRTVRSYAFVLPGAAAGTTVRLYPRVECNAAGKPLNVVVRSVHAAEVCNVPNGRLWRRPWRKVNAILESACAARRYPWLSGKPPRKPAHPAAVKHAAVTLFREFGGVPPATTGPCNADGCVTCSHCGTEHSSFAHYLAVCAPDAVA